MKSLVIDKINNQIKDCGKESLEYGVAQILIKLCELETAAELIYQDLDIEELSIEKCTKKLYEYAKTNRKGNSFGMSPDTAERLIKEFYSIPDEKQNTPIIKDSSDIDLLDLLEGF